MRPNDDELKEQLARGPLTRNGFDDRLRKRIDDAIERPQRRQGRFMSRFTWNGAGVAAIVVLLLAFGIWQWTSPNSSVDRFGTRMASPSGTEDQKLFSEAAAPIRSAVLLGLRTDTKAADGQIVSSYRTLLIAPDAGKLQVSAQGSGIVMPYKQNFWKIDAVPGAPGTRIQTLNAYQASGKGAKTAAAAAVPTPTVALTERLTFVGNQYVSVIQSATGSSAGTYRWVKDIQQVAANNARTEFDPLKEPHLSMENAMSGTTGGAAGTEQWSIERGQGAWIAESPKLNSPYEPVKGDMHAANEPLPETINKYDKLSVSLEQVRRIFPQAKDAFTSPTEDMLIAVGDRSIKVYPYRQLNGDKKPLTIALSPGETVIMAQWAMEDKYIDNWKTQVSAILK